MPTPHLHRLTPLADAWRHPITSPGEWFVPGFDPWSGGELSPVLVLMQSPGPATLAQGAHAICSEDNAGTDAKAFRAARIQSGLPRQSYLRWNSVPSALPHHRRPLTWNNHAPRLCNCWKSSPGSERS